MISIFTILRQQESNFPAYIDDEQESELLAFSSFENRDDFAKDSLTNNELKTCISQIVDSDEPDAGG